MPFTWLAAFDGNDLIGAIAWRAHPGIIDIHRLVVDPAAHRRGVGTALVRSVLDLAGSRPVFVATGASNQPARRLYERLGFALTGERDIIPGLRIAEFRLTPSPG
jgi:ribosomal protein S18 acetylase RimI-like enzyme